MPLENHVSSSRLGGQRSQPVELCFVRDVKRLLANAKVKRLLSNRYPKLLEEFEEWAALETI